jgi:[lysine-biosynthesis-protein LysW]--L-2-aminoadipate ligase
MPPEQALSGLRAGDVALGRLDVLSTLDGIDDGLWVLGALEARGVSVLNGASALIATHDKLRTARLLRRSGISHPRTFHVRPGRPRCPLTPPVVVKPRFGTGGADVSRCDDAHSLQAVLDELSERPWYPIHGAVVQELVPPTGYDLRVLVAGGQIVGSVFRHAAHGEWRTNVGLGASRRAVCELPAGAGETALVAARTVGADLVGVDLMVTPDDHWTVIELNGAVEFNHEYRLEADVFDIVGAQLLRHVDRPPRDATPSPSVVGA